MKHKVKNIVIAGTDTDIGKTACSALLMSVLHGTYFKPIQSGSKYGSKCNNDTNTIKKLSGLSDEHFLKEKYLLTEPLSPHLAAEIDGINIQKENLTLPENLKFNPLIVELAGGLMVPVNRQTLIIDVIKNWDCKVILCARTSLGTINHTLLSIEALKNRNIDIAGLVFIGEENKDNIKTITDFSKEVNARINVVGYIPQLNKINKDILIDTFYNNFDVKYFQDNYGI